MTGYSSTTYNQVQKGFRTANHIFTVKTLRPQSVHCSVCVSGPTQFRIRKCDISGAEKRSFNNYQHVVTRADRFFSRNPSSLIIFPLINLFFEVCQYSKSSVVLLNNGHKTCVHFLLTLLNYLCIYKCIYL